MKYGGSDEPQGPYLCVTHTHTHTHSHTHTHTADIFIVVYMLLLLLIKKNIFFYCYFYNVINHILKQFRLLLIQDTINSLIYFFIGCEMK